MDAEFRSATRRALFRKESAIPGEGTSAAKDSRRHIRVKVTMNVDGDLLDYFKARGESEGRSYQLLMNEALRAYTEGERPERLAREVGDILLTDTSFLDQLKKRIDGE